MRYMFSMMIALVLGGVAGAQEGKQLFNGKDLTGWDGNPQFWRVEEGAIVGETTPEKVTKGNTFLIYKGQAPQDYELRVKFRMLSPAGNSGIQYRSRDFGNWVAGGYQADFDATNQYTGICYEERGKRGIMADVGTKVTFAADGQKKVEKFGDAKEIRSHVKKGEWNEYVITAKGNHLTQAINGHKTVEIIDEDEKNRRMEGIIALQLHAGPPMRVEFKDIVLKELK